jgi:hypothetical protein
MIMKEYREESVFVLGIFDLSSKGSDSGSFMKDVSENTAIEIKPTTTDGTPGDDIKCIFTTLSLRSPSRSNSLFVLEWATSFA